MVIDHLASRPRPNAPSCVLPAAHVRRGRRHAGQQRGAGAALLPGVPVRTGTSARAGAGCDAVRRATASGRAGWRCARRRDARPCAAALPVLAPILQAAPAASFRIARREDPREPHRYSGRTAMHADAHVHEPKPPDDPDAPLSFSMEGYHGPPPPALTPFFWAPGWNSVQAVNKFQEEVGGPLRGGDPGVRLFEPPARDATRYFDGIPPPFASAAGEWLLCAALPHFRQRGTERAGAGSGGAGPATLSGPDAHGCRRPRDRDGRGRCNSTGNGGAWRLTARIHPAFAPGVAGLPVGLPACRPSPCPHGGSCAPRQSGGPEIMSAITHGWLNVFGILLMPAGHRRPLLIWIERRLLGLWQDRYGPNRVGPFGVLQVVADMIKIFIKEDWIPPFADRAVFVIAPAIIDGGAADRLRRDPDCPGHRRGRSQHRPAVFSGDVFARRLQRRARRLGVEQQVRAAGRRCVRPPRCSATRSSWACRSWAWSCWPARSTCANRGGATRHVVLSSPSSSGLVDFPHRRHRRDPPPAVRSAGGRERTGGRVTTRNIPA